MGRLNFLHIVTIFAGLAFLVVTSLPSHARTPCRIKRLERFLDKRAFELSAEQKIDLYADNLVRYYGKRNVSQSRVYRIMRNWERRWPERLYKFMRIVKFKKTQEGSACMVTYDYRFLAYAPRRDEISAGIGRTTLVLANIEDEGFYRIIGEFGKVRCRGLRQFARARC